MKLLTFINTILLSITILCSCYQNDFFFLTEKKTTTFLEETKRIEPTYLKETKAYFGNSLQKGKKYLQLLDPKPNYPSENVEKKDIEKRFFLKNLEHDIEQSKYQDSKYIKIESRGINNNSSEFYNLYGAEEIRCMTNVKDVQFSSVSNSSIIWNQINYIKNSKFSSDINLDISLKKSFKIINEDVYNLETLKTAWFAMYNKDKGKMAEYSFSANSAEGMAILGSPNGKASVWFCHDYWVEIGKKKPKEVNLFNLEYNEQGELTSMNMSVLLQ